MNPAPRESLPPPFDLRNRDPGRPQEVGERVEPLARDVAATMQTAVQGREDDPVLAWTADEPTDPDDVQERRGRFGYRSRS